MDEQNGSPNRVMLRDRAFDQHVPTLAPPLLMRPVTAAQQNRPIKPHPGRRGLPGRCAPEAARRALHRWAFEPWGDELLQLPRENSVTQYGLVA